MTETNRQMLFSVSNHHVADCGIPPGLPEDFDTGPYFRSYFQNKHGEQWLFWRHLDTGVYGLHGGDCGWAMSHQPIEADFETMISAMKKAKLPGLASQCVLAGVSLVSNMRVTHPRSLLVLDADGSLVTLNEEERLWIQSCLAATRQTELASYDSLVALFQRYVADMKAARRKSEESSSDDAS